MKKEIKTPEAPIPAGPYSQGIKTENRIYIAGQTPRDPKTGKVPETIEEQTRQVMTNLRSILEAAGSSMADVVKVSAFLSDLKYFDAFNSVYKEFFAEPYPVRTTIGCQLRGILVEVDVIAEI